MTTDKVGVIICGSSHFNDYPLLCTVTNMVLEPHIRKERKIEIVSGQCAGADMLGERYTREHGLALTAFKTECQKNSRAAGMVRNEQLIEYIDRFTSKLVIAFASPTSNGTLNMIKLAQRKNISVVQCKFENEACVVSFEKSGIERPNWISHCNEPAVGETIWLIDWNASDRKKLCLRKSKYTIRNYDLSEEELDHFMYIECEQKPEMSFNEYQEAIIKYLVLCSYHYSPAGAIEFVERFEKVIRREYDKKETVSEVAISEGYCCG